jgi:hypothetical protein
MRVDHVAGNMLMGPGKCFSPRRGHSIECCAERYLPGPNRGAKRVEIMLDGVRIFAGDLSKAPGVLTEAVAGAGPDGGCLPQHLTHFGTSSLEINDTL